jgi:transposase
LRFAGIEGIPRTGVKEDSGLGGLIRRRHPMTRPYSLDLRERVVDAVAEGSSARGAAEHFSIGASTAIKWSARQRRTGSVAPTPRPDSNNSKLNSHRDWLLALVESESDLTLAEIADRLLSERGVTASQSAIWRFYERNGVSYKKKDRPCRRTGQAGCRAGSRDLERRTAHA